MENLKSIDQQQKEQEEQEEEENFPQQKKKEQEEQEQEQKEEIKNKKESFQYAEALYDYVTTEKGFLNFKKGDLLCIVAKDQSNWLKAVKAKNDQWSEPGFIPSNYVKILENSL